MRVHVVPCLSLLAALGIVLPTSRLQAAAAASGGASRPNILWIMSDDHAVNAVGAYGGRLAPLNPTPALDRLAAEGIRFTQVVCGNSICTPSRATLMTGQHSHVNGVRTLDDVLPREKHTLPLLIRQAGYNTAMIGKWHLEEEPNGFDYYCVLPGQGTYFNPMFHDSTAGPWPDNRRHVTEGLVRHASVATHSVDAITEISLAWLVGRDKSKPFFLMHHFKSPHGNFENAERYDFLYEDMIIPEPASLRADPDHGSPATRSTGSTIGRRHARRNVGQQMFVDESLDDADYQRVAYQRYLKKYLRCVRGVDDGVARLVEHLRQTGELDRTIILYTSDQGQLLGEHDRFDKRWIYEESLRMPLIVRHPMRIRSGSTSDLLINNVDFAPTLLDLAGVPAPAEMQGRSFRAVLEGGPAPADWRTASYYRYWMHLAHHDVPAHYGIRTRDLKLVYFYGLPLDARNALPTPTPPAWELYDLRHDPEERRNVHGEPAYAEVAASLKLDLLRLKQEVGDTDERYPELMAVRALTWPEAGAN